MKTKSTRKSSTKTVPSGKSAQAELTHRLGPVRRVVSMTRASDTKAAHRLRLECKHVRVGTKRRTLRCRLCAKGSK